MYIVVVNGGNETCGPCEGSVSNGSDAVGGSMGRRSGMDGMHGGRDVGKGTGVDGMREGRDTGGRDIEKGTGVDGTCGGRNTGKWADAGGSGGVGALLWGLLLSRLKYWQQQSTH